MNGRQRAVLWAGVVVLGLMALVPPWRDGRNFDGYYFLFGGAQKYMTIDWPRLLLPAVVVVLVTGMGLLTTKRP